MSMPTESKDAFLAVMSVITNSCDCEASKLLRTLIPSLNRNKSAKGGKKNEVMLHKKPDGKKSKEIILQVVKSSLKSNCGCELTEFYKSNYNKFQIAVQTGKLKK